MFFAQSCPTHANSMQLHGCRQSPQPHYNRPNLRDRLQSRHRLDIWALAHCQHQEEQKEQLQDSDKHNEELRLVRRKNMKRLRSDSKLFCIWVSLLLLSKYYSRPIVANINPSDPSFGAGHGSYAQGPRSAVYTCYSKRRSSALEPLPGC